MEPDPLVGFDFKIGVLTSLNVSNDPVRGLGYHLRNQGSGKGKILLDILGLVAGITNHIDSALTFAVACAINNQSARRGGLQLRTGF